MCLFSYKVNGFMVILPKKKSCTATASVKDNVCRTSCNPGKTGIGSAEYSTSSSEHLRICHVII